MDDCTKDFPRDSITCDGPTCNIKSPSKRCSRCRTCFYCSTQCQKQHWKEHKLYCFPIGDMKDKSKQQQREEDKLDSFDLLQEDDEHKTRNDDTECSICLTCPMDRPVTLKQCQHSFCTICLLEWQKQVRKLQENPFSNSMTCPLCRTNSENVEQTLLDRAAFLAGEANVRKKLTQDERAKLRIEALSCLDQVLEVDGVRLQAYVTRAEILISLKDGKAAAETIDTLIEENKTRNQHRLITVMDDVTDAERRGDHEEALRFREEANELLEQHGPPPARLGKGDMFRVHKIHSRAYQEQQDWKNAIECHKRALMSIEDPDMVPVVELRQLWMELADCTYKVGKYENSIQASDAAITMNRHFDQVHYYKVLALKQLGQLDDAITTISQAVIYETPWNNENITKNLQLYKELITERDTSK